MSDRLTCAKAPCASCPYRRDVPSGVWERGEYEKLRAYDAPTWEQPLGVFMCHQADGRLCAGWVATHDAGHLLAFRLNPPDPAVFTFVSPVPVFGSGHEAAAHGEADIDDPGPEAAAVIERLTTKREKR